MPEITVVQVGPTHEVRVRGLSRDEADGLGDRLRKLVAELETGGTPAPGSCIERLDAALRRLQYLEARDRMSDDLRSVESILTGYATFD